MNIDEKEIGLADIIGALKRRAKLLAIVTLVVFLAGIALALLLPSIFRSQAIILIEKQEIPTDLVRSTVTSFADQRIQVISQRVMSSANLTRIIEQYDLYTEDKTREPREVILDRMRSKIALEMISADVVDPRSGRPTEATIAFSLAFEDRSAQKSQRVVNELVTLFLNENLQSRKDSATETTSFLNDEAERLRILARELEEKIATFKDENSNSRPELEGLTRDLMNRTELRLAEVDRRIHETVQQKIYLEAELARYEPSLPDAGPRGTSALEQLRSTEAFLSSAEASYGEEHPDVIRLRKQAEALRATVDPNEARTLYEGQLVVARANFSDVLERYEDTHPDVRQAEGVVKSLQRKLDALPPPSDGTPNNPAYVALAARLEAAVAQLVSLEASKRKLSAKIDAYSENLMLIPDAEAEFRALNRDYESTLTKYREISAKQMEASLSQNLESERKGEKFTLIEPPLLPEKPAKPNRLAIIAIFLVLSVTAGLGAVGVIETLDDKVRGRGALQGIFAAPPLAYIPVIDGPGTSMSGSRIIWPLVLAGFAILFTGFAVHSAVMPLDVLWFTILRKIGL